MAIPSTANWTWGTGGFSTVILPVPRHPAVDQHDDARLSPVGSASASTAAITSPPAASSRCSNREEPSTEQNNILNAGTFGVRWRPMAKLQVNLEGEIGRANHPFYPIADKDYHGFTRPRSVPDETSPPRRRGDGRLQLQHRFAYQRTVRTTATTPRTPPGRLQDWFSVDASFAKLHVDSLTGIQYFAAGQLIADHSWYLSNIYSGTLGLHFSIREPGLALRRLFPHPGRRRRPRITHRNARPVHGVRPFRSPTVRPSAGLSVRLRSRLRWNAGYQYYRYREDLQDLQNYRANTGYTSLSWSF